MRGHYELDRPAPVRLKKGIDGNNIDGTWMAALGPLPEPQDRSGDPCQYCQWHPWLCLEEGSHPTEPILGGRAGLRVPWLDDPLRARMQPGGREEKRRKKFNDSLMGTASDGPWPLDPRQPGAHVST